MAMTSYYPGGAEVPAPGGENYPGPTPHAAKVDHTIFEAPTSLPEGNPAAPAVTGLDCIDGI